MPSYSKERKERQAHERICAEKMKNGINSVISKVIFYTIV